MSSLRDILGSRWTRCAGRIVGLAFTILILFILIFVPHPILTSHNLIAKVNAQVLNWCETTGPNLTGCTWYTLKARNFGGVYYVDSFFYGQTAAGLQAAINDSGNGGVFVTIGTYNLGTANPAVIWKTGVRMECASNQSVNFSYTGTGVAFQFGNGTTGVQYGIMENCGISLGAAGATAIQLKGNSSANNNPSSKNLFRKNFITGNGFANTTGIAVLDNSYVNRFEYDEIVNIQTPIKMGTANFSGESNVIWGDVIGCNGIASSIGINIAQTAGPVETYILGGDIVGCATGISINTGNQGTAYVGGGMHMEQNGTDIACVNTTTGGYIEGIDTTGTPAGAFSSVHGITFVGCQNWKVDSIRQTGTYSADRLNLDTTSQANTFIGVADPTAATTVMASGATNTFIGSTQTHLLEQVGGIIRSYRGATTLTQYGEFFTDGNGANVNSSAGIGQTNLEVGSTLTWSCIAGGCKPAQSGTVATLPTCNATNQDVIRIVTDATAPAYNAALTGAGAVRIPVYCNGSAWTAH